MKQEIHKLGQLIHTSQKILLINHARMDGDAWGSLGGLALILKNMEKTVACINDDPVPEHFSFLGQQELITPELNVADFAPDIIISLDAADLARLGESYKKWESIFQKTPFIVIDHHISNHGFGDINIIDPQASSVCELLVDIITELSLEKYITPQIATFLYTGLQTDSNMYFNTNTRSNTLRTGAKLIDLGADFRLPIMHCYKQRTQNQIRFWQYAFEHMSYHYSGKVCYCNLPINGLRELGIAREEMGGYFKGLVGEILINIQGVSIAFLLQPLGEGRIKVSMRSQEGYDVNQICEQFGGGGHTQAAGFETEDTPENIEQQLLTIISETYDFSAGIKK